MSAPLPLPPSDMIGRRIAGYRLEREIGRGGMAVVYQAEDLRLGRTVAVKLLAPELARNDLFRKRFEYESHVAASIDHPHIVPVFDAGEAEGVLFIAMRYVHGRDLRVLLDREGPLSLQQATRIAAQVASALDAAHAHDLVHRDVKPGNILVAEGTDSDHPEHVYLTDFGLTKKSLSLTGLTTVGQFVGTVDYVAPEQISGRPVDGRCDVYSLGCVVFECLAGGSPFRREDELAMLWAHLHEPPPPLPRHRTSRPGLPQLPDLPEALDATLAKALAKTPGERYDSCLAFVAAVRAAGTVGAHSAAAAAVREPTRLVPVLRHPPPPPPWATPVYATAPDPNTPPT
ncbi:serine/threonine-protein kinase [Streptacidiphilus sp. N1-3]|uniref:non-specific serine/threonine protein kinase n=1 Tax=Streptacidiphilus alkalitolerans TaxID=3342712 RepID=A0ABV6WTX3_9ACTN